MPAFGLVEYCRVSCDVGLDWDDVWYMRLFHRERVSTKQALNNTVFRRQLNGRAYGSDPDVFFLREENCKLTAEQKRTLATVNALLGNVFLTSDMPSRYTEAQRQSTAVCAPSLSTPPRCRWKRKTTASISGICWTELHKNYVLPPSDSVNKPQQNSTRPCTVLCTQLWQGAGCKRPECRIRDSVLPPCRKVHRGLSLTANKPDGDSSHRPACFIPQQKLCTRVVNWKLYMSLQIYHIY